MSNLSKYIDQVNTMNNLFSRHGKGVRRNIDVRYLTIGDANYLFESLAGDLSPENLCCDGELRGAALQRKATMLNGAKAELLKKGFREPNYYA